MVLKVSEESIPVRILEFRQELRKKPTLAEKRFLKSLQLVADKINFKYEFQSVYHHQELNKYYIVDFDVPFYRLIIEIDGATHETKEQRRIDIERDQVFVESRFKILRVKNKETKYQDVTIKKICNSLLKTSHALKAYSILKKIEQLEQKYDEIHEQMKAQLDEAFIDAFSQIFVGNPGAEADVPGPPIARAVSG